MWLPPVLAEMKHGSGLMAEELTLLNTIDDHV
jgi:hypothetical protein